MWVVWEYQIFFENILGSSIRGDQAANPGEKGSLTQKRPQMQPGVRKLVLSSSEL